MHRAQRHPRLVYDEFLPCSIGSGVRGVNRDPFRGGAHSQVHEQGNEYPAQLFHVRKLIIVYSTAPQNTPLIPRPTRVPFMCDTPQSFLSILLVLPRHCVHTSTSLLPEKRVEPESSVVKDTGSTVRTGFLLCFRSHRRFTFLVICQFPHTHSYTRMAFPYDLDALNAARNA